MDGNDDSVRREAQWWMEAYHNVDVRFAK